MRGWKGMAAGVLALIALQTVVSTPGAAGRTGGIFEWIGYGAQRFLDPAVPAFGAIPGPGPAGVTPSGSATNTLPPNFGFANLPTVATGGGAKAQ